MARWTNNVGEAQEIVKVNSMLSTCWAEECYIQTKTGTLYEGWLKGCSMGNNAGASSGSFSIPTSWYAELFLVTTSGEIGIDFLDVDVAAVKSRA